MAKRRRRLPARTPRGTTGLRPGEKSSEYPMVTLRLPEEVRLKLETGARVLRRPQWRIALEALNAYLNGGPPLSDEERRAVRDAMNAG